jgi:hypothetical protein
MAPEPRRAGHGLRAGFLTSAAARGASLFKMMDVSRHKSVETLRGCVTPMRSGITPDTRVDHRHGVRKRSLEYCRS